MTNWPEALAWMVIAPCALLAWVAWLKWGQKSAEHTETVLKGLQEPTWTTKPPWSACTCGQSSNLPCPVHGGTGTPSPIDSPNTCESADRRGTDA